ncbi:hypothetical protein D1BOALGB6SA_9443 [Olavius sp. associated proteobacterium Delta 1]|nr:hypothetical protein D1BOALGB6SA_9443 [Olavius sp. associated proteobacterium Delta 1]
MGQRWVKIISGLYFFSLCLFNKYDAIYVRELEINPMPRWISILYRIPLYIEINNILSGNLKMRNAKPNYIKSAMIHQAADLRHAQGLIIPAYTACQSLIRSYKLKPEKAHVILNGFDQKIIRPTDRRAAIKRLKLPRDGFNLGYLGTIWQAYDMYGLLEAIKICQPKIPQLRLILIGAGPMLNDLIAEAQKLDLDSCLIVVGYIQPEELHTIMGAIDVGLIYLTRAGIKFGGPITTRFATFAGFRIPVIANDCYMDQYPAQLRQGLVLTRPADPQSLAEAICWLYAHPQERQRRGEILYDFAVNGLTWRAVVKKILAIVKLDQAKGRSKTVPV